MPDPHFESGTDWFLPEEVAAQIPRFYRKMVACPTCAGSGYIFDRQSRSGRAICGRCLTFGKVNWDSLEPWEMANAESRDQG